MIQQTVSYDDRKNMTFPLRSKEEADDYRYFPEPDLNPLEITENMVSRIRSELPPLPDELFLKFTGEFKLGAREAEGLIESLPVAMFFEEMTGKVEPKTAANWILGPIKSWMNENDASIEDFPVATSTMIELLRIVVDGLISYTAA